MSEFLTQWQEAPLPELPPLDAPLIDVPENLHDVVGLAQVRWAVEILAPVLGRQPRLARTRVPGDVPPPLALSGVVSIGERTGGGGAAPPIGR